METNKLYVGDCIELMKSIPDRSIDMILTDPPYEFITKSGKSGGGFYRNEKKKYIAEVEKNIGLSFNPIPLLEASKRLCKKFNGYYFTNKNLLKTYISWADENKYNWEILLRLKPNPLPLFHSHYLFDKEYIIYIHEQGVTFNSDMKMQNYYTYQSHPIGAAIHNHPTVKPKEILYNYIKISSNEGDLVLDPYIGSGTTAVVCKKLKRKYIGIDINPDYIDTAERRLKNI